MELAELGVKRNGWCLTARVACKGPTALAVTSWLSATCVAELVASAREIFAVCEARLIARPGPTPGLPLKAPPARYPFERNGFPLWRAA